jgi:type IX secretion system PorP/SprF family membrane protein
MKKYLLLIVIVQAFWQKGQTQDEATYRHYHLNPVLVNPGYTGFEDRHNLMFNYNNRWASFPGSPKTVTASYHGPVGARIGLGGMFVSDRIASLRRTKVQMSYGFKFLLNDFKFNVGLSTAYEQSELKGTAILDPLLDLTDEALIEATDGVEIFDAAFGVHASYNKFSFGLAFPNMIRARVDEELVAGEDESTIFRYYLAYFGYDWDLGGEYNFRLEPSMTIRDVRHAPLQVDFNVKANLYEDQLVGGFTYTLGGGNRFSILLGTQLTNFGLYYSYTTSFQQFQQYNDGSHEVSIAFRFGERKEELEEVGQ